MCSRYPTRKGNVVKRCICCGEEKPISEFYDHPQMGDKHLGKCKVCIRSYSAARRTEHPERIMLTRIATCAKDPSHQNAHRAVEAAVMCGALVKPDRCGVCGGVNPEHGVWRIHSHHVDYSKPLAVLWLCPKCHSAAHAANRVPVPCAVCGKEITPGGPMNSHLRAHSRRG